MTFEHVALNLADYEEAADWYRANLGMTTVREVPGKMIFLADEAGTVVFELYSNPEAPHLDPHRMHALTLHVAFAVDDVEQEARRLVESGCSITDPVKSVGNDTLAMLRDPHGVSIQLVHRG